ncbi:phage protein, partial [Enterococcus faecium]
MSAKLSGKNFDVNLGDSLLHVEAASLDVTDNSAVAQSKGVPNGWV